MELLVGALIAALWVLYASWSSKRAKRKGLYSGRSSGNSDAYSRHRE